ncbi:hypothetical protein LR48_Vigan02g086000 [Vigna angularis]|uniref:Uncharacterized protein n=1 Tax=Phaseolus angularis TaxID=3914 RepID=A0A0L9TVY1_PHAAN|nr:hypothetical protein LR48_Vigan02g086000 [Vigna angularis]
MLIAQAVFDEDRSSYFLTHRIRSLFIDVDNVQIMKDMNFDVYKFYMVKNSSEAVKTGNLAQPDPPQWLEATKLQGLPSLTNEVMGPTVVGSIRCLDSGKTVSDNGKRRLDNGKRRLDSGNRHGRRLDNGRRREQRHQQLRRSTESQKQEEGPTMWNVRRDEDAMKTDKDGSNGCYGGSEQREEAPARRPTVSAFDADAGKAARDKHVPEI